MSQMWNESAIQHSRRTMQLDLDLDAKRVESFQKIHEKYQAKRSEILGAELQKAISEAAAQSHTSECYDWAVSQLPRDRQLSEIEQLRRYRHFGVDIEALRRLDQEFASHVRSMRGTCLPYLPMNCEVTDSAHVELAAPSSASRIPVRSSASVFQLTSPSFFHAPYGVAVTNEGYSLADPGVLGNHSDATDPGVGRLGADLYMAHIWDFTSSGDSYNYARNTGFYTGGTISINGPTFIRVTVRVVCEACDMNYTTTHTPWWDPRDSDSQIELLDLLFVGAQGGFSSTLPGSGPLVSAGELAYLRAHEDAGFDSRLIRRPGDLLTFSTVLPRPLTPANDTECPFVFVGIKHYAFLWAKYVKFDARSFTRWNVLDVTVTEA